MTNPTPSGPVLILHGWGGNKPEHWQEHLARGLSEAGVEVHAPKMPNPMYPVPEAWLSEIRQALGGIADKSRLTVVAHSLGAISWMHLAASSEGDLLAERVLLVAPPYVIPEIPPLDAPPGVPAFFPPPLSEGGVRAAAGETAIIASDNDDYATYEQTDAYAKRLGVTLYKLEGAGHISPYWGYGDWPWILQWCLHQAELPPLPR